MASVQYMGQEDLTYAILSELYDCETAPDIYAEVMSSVMAEDVYSSSLRDTASELIAHNRTVEEVCELIGADWLVYQDLEDLVECSLEGNPQVDGFDCSVFNGNYVTGDVNEAYFNRLEAARNDSSKAVSEAAFDMGEGIDLHNDEAI